MLRRRTHQVEIVAVREDHLETLLRRRCQRLLAAPRLNGDAVRQTRLQHFIPTDHALVMRRENLLHAAIEVGLQAMLVVQMVFADEGANVTAGLPLLRIHFVAADVEVLVGEQAGHLAQKPDQEFVGGLARRIHGCRQDAVGVDDLIGALAAAQLRIRGKPTGMSNSGTTRTPRSRA